MFGFLKKKLKEAVDKFTKKAEDEADVIEEVVEEVEVPVEKKPVKKEKPKKVEKKEEKKKEPEPEVVEEIKEKDEVVKKPVKEKVIKEEKGEKVKEDVVKVVEKEEEETEEEPIDEEEVKEEFEEKVEEEEEEKKEKKGFFKKIFGKKEEISETKVSDDARKPDKVSDKVEGKKTEEEVKEPEPELAEEKVEEPKVVEEPEEEVKEKEEEEEKPKGLFQKIKQKITKVSLSDEKFDELFWELELALLENNVAVEVIGKIKEDLKNDLVKKNINKKEIDAKIIESLKKSIESLFDVPKIDMIKQAKKKKPYIIMFVGVNGAGKTTNLAKVAYMLKQKKLSCVVGACDTFRAAAIQQLEEHADNVGVKVIKHDYGSDPAAVAFDTVEHAKSKDIDVVLIDTAGRLHSNQNLMAELEKINRVAKPDLKIFVGESLAGNDVVEQVKLFNQMVEIDGIILTKADTDEKGGAAISVSHVTKKPILYLGMGQGYEDLEEFDKNKLLKQIGL